MVDDLGQPESIALPRTDGAAAFGEERPYFADGPGEG
jgi:hypothetical protein